MVLFKRTDLKTAVSEGTLCVSHTLGGGSSGLLSSLALVPDAQADRSSSWAWSFSSSLSRPSISSWRSGRALDTYTEMGRDLSRCRTHLITAKTALTFLVHWNIIWCCSSLRNSADLLHQDCVGMIFRAWGWFQNSKIVACKKNNKILKILATSHL